MLKDLKRLLAKCHWSSKEKMDFYKGAKLKYFVGRVEEILQTTEVKKLTEEQIVTCIKLLNFALYRIEKANGPVSNSEDKTVGTGSKNRTSDHGSPQSS